MQYAGKNNLLYLYRVKNHLTYLLIGGNEGNREEWLAKATVAIADSCGSIRRSSACYETAAWGKEDQRSFLNQVLELETPLSPAALLQQTTEIENLLGRQRTEKWGARTLDIDLLFYDDVVMDEPDLKIPHPFLQERRFTLVPLQELVPDLVHPVLQVSIQTLLDQCTDLQEVQLYL